MYLGNMSFEEMEDLPKTIYKYRSWDDKFHKTILTDRVVFMAPPTSFEDKKDCKLLKRYDLMTESDIFNKYLAVSKEEHVKWNSKQHQQFAKEWTKKSPLKNTEYVKENQKQYFNEFDSRMGILSLTANPLNIEMWYRYANNGGGFCVGFNPIVLFKLFGGGMQVQYYDDLPIIYYNDDYHVEHFKQVFSKEKKWNFEEEYRTTKFYRKSASDEERKIVVAVEAFKEIIFGWNISKRYKAEIKKVCNKQGMNIEYKSAILDNNKIIINTCD